MTEWQNRPLDPVYPVIFIDAIYVKTRDGQVANRLIYVAPAVTNEGHRDILGLWVGDGGEWRGLHREVGRLRPMSDQQQPTAVDDSAGASGLWLRARWVCASRICAGLGIHPASTTADRGHDARELR
jgi:hypothetical protein